MVNEPTLGLVFIGLFNLQPISNSSLFTMTISLAKWFVTETFYLTTLTTNHNY